MSIIREFANIDCGFSESKSRLEFVLLVILVLNDPTDLDNFLNLFLEMNILFLEITASY